MARSTRRYASKLKFQVVLEALQGQKTPRSDRRGLRRPPEHRGIMEVEVDRERFVGSRESIRVSESDGHIAELEQLLVKSEVETALLENFLVRPDDHRAESRSGRRRS